MTQSIQAIRGMNDILPSDSPYWQKIEACLYRIARNYGYQEIRLPIVESTHLFKRSIGEVTDIVEKEMYTFDDRNGDSLSLRPEGTAVCVRAALQHGMLHRQSQRLWYTGPMFRHERPQKGRYRQFFQMGVEAFGLPGPDIDAELILMTARFWRELGLHDQIKLQLNSLGTLESRQRYRQVLIDYFEKHQDQLDEDSQRRLHSNPLRILDSKNPDMQALITAAPNLLDYIDEESQQHFQQLQQLLTAAGIDYQINPRLVRGLDYYSHTVFEWVTDTLGAQGTVCAGGRYDSLVSQLGGKDCPAVGFALGLDRLVLLYQQQQQLDTEQFADIYVIMVGDKALPVGIGLTEQLREQFPQLRIVNHCGGGSFKSQFKKADKSGADIALLLGDDEIEQQQVSIKFLREQKDQQTIEQTQLQPVISQLLAKTE